jgi:hypothetical protein
MNMSDIAWATEHSVETTATPAFTWTYMTAVKNWDDPPAEFRLNGSFTSGSLGTTKIPGQAPRQWRREVKPHDSYTIEIALEGAVILCMWVFKEIPNNQTRLTQHITLEGENASSYKGDVQRTFDPALDRQNPPVADCGRITGNPEVILRSAGKVSHRFSGTRYAGLRS